MGQLTSLKWVEKKVEVTYLCKKEKFINNDVMKKDRENLPSLDYVEPQSSVVGPVFR